MVAQQITSSEHESQVIGFGDNPRHEQLTVIGNAVEITLRQMGEKVDKITDMAVDAGVLALGTSVELYSFSRRHAGKFVSKVLHFCQITP